jgi:hypothetical protein
MTKLQKKFASAVAAGAMLVKPCTACSCITQLVISGNGADSDNKADVKIETTTTVVQTNVSDIKQ